ncbi:MAG: hypothetical protein ACR2PJ_05500 [Pseudomonadales bacterium]
MFDASLNNPGELALRGSVTLDGLVAATGQVDELLEKGLEEEGAATLEVNLADIHIEGTAILLLLLHIQRLAAKQGIAQPTFTNAPPQLTQLARPFGLADLLF